MILQRTTIYSLYTIYFRMVIGCELSQKGLSLRGATQEDKWGLKYGPVVLHMVPAGILYGFQNRDIVRAHGADWR